MLVSYSGSHLSITDPIGHSPIYAIRKVRMLPLWCTQFEMQIPISLRTSALQLYSQNLKTSASDTSGSLFFPEINFWFVHSLVFIASNVLIRFFWWIKRFLSDNFLSGSMFCKTILADHCLSDSLFLKTILADNFLSDSLVWGGLKKAKIRDPNCRKTSSSSSHWEDQQFYSVNIGMIPQV